MLTLFTTNYVDGPATSHSGQPAAQGSPTRIEGEWPAPQSNKDILGDILGQGGN